MGKKETSQLQKVSQRLSDFVEQFAAELGRSERRHWCKVYLTGLMLDGERKSIEPIANRVEGGDEQCLQQFVNQSPWDHPALLRALRQFILDRLSIHRGVLVLDDTALPKKGRHSVGVAHQYCGALGKLSNCQSLVSLQYVGKKAHVPLSAQLYLPEAWTSDVDRMNRTGVPVEYQQFKEKWRIALDLVDEVMAEGITPKALVFDAGYGANRAFLKELDFRDLRFVGQCRNEDTFWDGAAPIDASTKHSSGNGRPRKHVHIGDRRLKPKSAESWGDILFSSRSQVHRLKLRTQSGKTWVEFAAMRVFEAVARPFHTVGPERWLIVERLADGSRKYYVSSFPKEAKPRDILLVAHERWKVEQGYQQLKEELGLDHFEGRSWQGLHHHVALCFMAYDFLQLLRQEKIALQKKPASERAASSVKIFPPFQLFVPS